MLHVPHEDHCILTVRIPYPFHKRLQSLRSYASDPGDHGFGEPVAKNLIVDDDDDSSFCGTPAISGDELFLRSNRFLYCIAEQ